MNKLIYINCNVSGFPVSHPYIISDGYPDKKYEGYFLDVNRCQFILPCIENLKGWGATVYWDNGKSARTVIPVDPGAYEGGLLDPPIPTLDYGIPLPNFTRDEICGSKITLSGLRITTAQFGEKPWFELAWQCLTDYSDRKAVLDQKKNAGDTAQIIEFFRNQRHIYDEPGQWLQPLITNVGEFDQELFKSYVREILEAGLIPVVVFDGDNGDNPVDGYPNALRQLPIVTSLLDEFNTNGILYARFWDGVFYGSTPENIQHFGREFRKILPNGHLAIEFNPGHIPVGNGPSDYELPNGMMVDYDVIAGEYYWPSANHVPPAIVAAEYEDGHGYVPVWASDASNWLQVWQIVARMVDKYNAPSNQPFNVSVKAINGPEAGKLVLVSSDTANPVNYLRTGNRRGKYFFWSFELGAYEWVRDRVTVNELKNAGDYFRSLSKDMIVGLP